METEVLSAIVGAAVALVVATIAPLYATALERRRELRTRKERALGDLRGLSRQLVSQMKLLGTARVGSYHHGAIVDSFRGSADQRGLERAQDAYDRAVERGNDILIDLVATERELHRVFSEITLLFPRDPDIRTLIDSLSAFAYPDVDPPPTTIGVDRLDRWAETFDEKVILGVEERFRQPLAALARLVEAHIRGRRSPTG